MEQQIIMVGSAVGIGFVLLLGIALTIARFYRQVDQGKVLIVNNLKAEPKVSFTGAVVLPIIHRAQVMDISLKRVEIDPSLMQDDKAMLEDLIAAAVNDAVRRVEQMSKDKLSGLTAGMSLPPGMKLPF